MKVEKVGEICGEILSEVSKVIVGKDRVLKWFLTGILANGHILIEDYPGLAKTLMAKTFAATMGCEFRRIQFTPDLLPADIIGTYVFNQKTGEFNLRKGPIFTHILLADEVNRSPPKTQAALLEAMQERQVTIEGEMFRLGPPFIVIATQNPIEFEGVYPLPEAQIDRFMMRLRVGYPDKDHEKEIIDRRENRGTEEVSVRQVIDRDTLVDLQRSVEQVKVHDDVKGYIVEITATTRNHPQVELGVSPRGTLALWHLSRAYALLQGRDYVIPDDVRDMAPLALSHRLILKTGSWLQGLKAESVVEDVISKTPTPKIA